VSTGSFSIDHASVFFPLFALVYHLALLSVWTIGPRSLFPSTHFSPICLLLLSSSNHPRHSTCF
jgi:hypothetical protein